MGMAQARRIALAAQGLARRRPETPVGTAALGRTFKRLQLLQIDSVNVLTRAHYLPLFSRLGPYDTALLDRMGSAAPRKMVEYWAHEASFIRPEHFADLRNWQRRTWMGKISEQDHSRRELAERIMTLLEAGPPLTARQVREKLGHSGPSGNANWGWNWSEAKEILEVLFAAGEVGSAGRNSQFERRYAPTHHVLPTGVALEPTESLASIDRLTAAAASAHGIGSAKCLADYFRLPRRETNQSIDRLIAAGTLEPVEVDGWSGIQYLHEAAAKPRRAEAVSLLSPFDSLVFERRRLEQLFGFHYRIEIYTPAAKRRFGYYVLPFLLRDAMVARVDLKADRETGRLLVRSAHAEDGAPKDTATELAGELARLACFLKLDVVEVEAAGNLSASLSIAMRLRGTRE